MSRSTKDPENRTCANLPPADLLNKATAAATNAANTVVNTAQQAYNSETAANLTSQAQTAGTAALNAATNLAGQAHQQAHNAVPHVIPAPAAKEGGVVDQSHDLEPNSPTDRAKLETLFQGRTSADELQDKGILKGESGGRALVSRQRERERERETDEIGQPGDALAGKKAELEKSMLEVSSISMMRSTAADDTLETPREGRSLIDQDKLDKGLASRPSPEELVKKGILSRESCVLRNLRK